MHTPDGLHLHLNKPSAYATLMDEAKARALQARRESQEAFWTAVGQALRGAWLRLHRHAGQRADRHTTQAVEA